MEDLFFVVNAKKTTGSLRCEVTRTHLVKCLFLLAANEVTLVLFVVRVHVSKLNISCHFRSSEANQYRKTNGFFNTVPSKGVS